MKKSLLIALLSISLGCSNNSSTNQIDHFLKNESSYRELLNLIKKEYIDGIDGEKLPRKSILLCDGVNRFKPTDYRICDPVIEEQMRKLDLDVIDIEKNICYAEMHFDLVSFGISHSKNVYYRYSFCEPKDSADFENNSIEIKYIKEGWSLYTEK